MLVRWCCASVDGEAFEVDDTSVQDLEDEVDTELRVAADYFAGDSARGCMEAAPESDDVEAESRGLAESLAAPERSWPRVADEPSAWKAPGKFAKALPLCFPMGLADLYDDRCRDVSAPEWVQHLLRHASGMFVQGLRGHREV